MEGRPEAARDSEREKPGSDHSVARLLGAVRSHHLPVLSLRTPDADGADVPLNNTAPAEGH